MAEYSILQVPVRGIFRSLSMGVKLILICFLALFMTIPSFFVYGLVNERTNRAKEVANEIGSGVGGPQTFLGPTLAIPYSAPGSSPSAPLERGTYFVFPAEGNAAIKTATEERHRSLFRVPVFQADLVFDANFDLTGVPEALPKDATLNWDRAEVLVGVSDARGALADAVLTSDAGTVTLTPAKAVDSVVMGEQKQQKLSLIGAQVSEAKPGNKFHVKSVLKFSGANRIAVLAYGKTTRLTAQGDWRTPGFDGGIPPATRNLNEQGYTATWTVPFIARNVRSEGAGNILASLDTTNLGISFVEVADPYQSVERSLKYALLFLGMVFLSYFVFEATTRKSVHPAQYVLVGIAQLIFYLLLLSFAERIGFNYGFLIAGAATVGLLSINAAWIFESRMQGLRAFAIFSLLYTLIYLLLTLEDNALLVGSVTSFLVVAAAMYFTRTIDWSGSVSGASSSVPVNQEGTR
ncbi:cell envelope integrity protein CreD [Terriglobus albidus]|uniref:Cell envelope integrity protein CreD n=1 Tax=Terriglobus albidus TaxID=1592106 RepID=A0A5B9E4W4_9BACT|nr:cell envelope integrity protein CreD [Terriglobus albidus]QEE27292.1 cell envelope integrity protein CreD [Terriglobus albidus]